ncbi:hypothetical protein CsSME_00053863 [Camellia sinensis var. sinensis]|uniref:Uncharacterized protein n=1 Tax=Camellia sinensis TaxID=4442 RepID=A0A7J7G023_CAMSI|nr:hypothetical protein HYC85_030204 [Camellia sinensis]
MRPFETVDQLPPVVDEPPPESALQVPPLPLTESVVQVSHPLDAEAEPSELLAQAPPPSPSGLDAPPEPVIPRNAQQQELELPRLVVGFCMTAAFEIAFRSIQTRKHYPITFQLLCLLMVFAFASLVVAKYIAANHPNPGRFLEHAGILCGVTAFFVAITVPFPLYLKLISWIVYALSLLAISICNCPRPP